MAHDFERLVCGPVPLHHASHVPPPHAGEDRSMIQLAAFYLFAFVVIASAAMVIFARNPVHSVMWLILAFFNAAGLMLLAGAEFIAMLQIGRASCRERVCQYV